MKLLGNLLLAVSLAVGALAAATAYLVPLDLPETELKNLTLAVDAGSPGSTTLKEGQALTPAAVASLRSTGTSYVFVNQFEVARWPGKWAFLAAVLGLLASAGLLRTASQRHLTAAAATGAGELPDQALRVIGETINGLRRDLANADWSAGVQERLVLIRERLGELQRTHMTAFVEARPLLVARLGLGGYAELMDRYAAAERQINRAWSAAADGVLDESVRCLDQAAELLDEAAAVLGGRRGG